MGIREAFDRFMYGPNSSAIVPASFTELAADVADPGARQDAGAIAIRGQVDANRRPDWIIAAGKAIDWTEWDRVRIDAVRKCVTVFACSTILSDAVAEAQLTIQHNEGDQWAPATSAAARMAQLVINRPNPFMEDAEFLGLLVMAQCLQGYAVVEKQRQGNGLVRELWPLRPDWLSRRPNRDGTGAQWSYKMPGKPERIIPDDDIIILPYRHDDLMVRYGVSPVIVAAREIGIDSALTDFIKNFLDHGGIPPFVMMTDELIEDNSLVTKIQTDWSQKYGGAAAASSLPVLHGGMQIQKVGDGIGEMAWPDLRGLTELKICSAFRVPAGLVQAREALISGPLTSTESDGDMEVLQRYGAGPLRDRMAAALGRALMPEFGLDDGTYRFYFDTSNVLSLQENTDAKHTRVRSDLAAKLITIAEAREMLGYDPLPGTDVFVVNFSDMFVAPADLVSATEDDPTPAPAPTSTNAAVGAGQFRRLPAPPRQLVKRNIDALSAADLEVRANSVRRVHRDRRKLIEIGTRQLRKFFKDQGARIAGAFEKAEQAFDTKQFDPLVIATRSEADIFWSDEQIKLSEVLQRFYTANGEAAFLTSGAMLDAEIPWDGTNPRIRYLQDQLGNRIVRISERTRSSVIKEITAGTQEGQSTAQIADRIRFMFEETWKSRAETIARTETQVAYNQSSALAYAESGLVDQVELLDNPDHDEDYGAADGLSCAERDGLVVDLVDVDIHIAGEHPNGSLVVVPILRTPIGE